MRPIYSLVLHCSDSNLSVHDNIQAIRYWHVIERKWDDVGYHFVVTKKMAERGRDVWLMGAGVKGHNKDTIHICLTGKDNFTEAQFEMTAHLCFELLIEFGLEANDIYGHNHFDKNKTCPNFDVGKEIRERVNARFKQRKCL